MLHLRILLSVHRCLGQPLISVYCPGKTGSLIFGESISDERLSWAPIMDMWNEWVQVADGKSQCVTYSGIYKRQPSWGLLGGEDTNGENRDHIM